MRKMSTTACVVCKFHRQLLQRYGWKMGPAVAMPSFPLPGGQLLTLQLPAAPVAAHIRSWAQLCHWGVQRHLCQATTPVTQHTLLKDEASLQNSEPPRNPLSTQTASQHMAISPSMPIPPKVKEILHSLRTGSRSSLAEAITLVETKHPVKHKQAQWLLTKVLSHRSKQLQLGKLKPTLRIGLSGPPGAGKSTIIERLGQLLTTKGFKVAVLAVDPSSSRTGGSILGDKTRMPNLSKDPRAFIRPSPSGGSLGGVTRSTSEAISLCEGAGYDIIIVETVGVGQSETAVCELADMFVLVIPPAAGDELQGLKKGIVELADLVVINKADGDLLPAAQRIKGEYTSALKLVRNKTPHWQPKVIMLSALSGVGLEELWKTVEEYCQKMKDSQEFDAKRKNQQRLWLWNHINWQLRERFMSHPGMSEHIEAMEKRVMAGSLAPGTAADLLLDEFIKLK